MTSGTSTLGHQPRRICLWALGHAHAHLTEGFMHQARRATDRTALRRRDGRWTTGVIEIVLRLRRFGLPTPLVPCASPRARHPPHRPAEAPPSPPPSPGG